MDKIYEVLNKIYEVLKQDVSWLRKHAATEDGLAKSTRELRLAIENLRQFTGDKFDRLRVTLKALARAGERRAQGIERTCYKICTTNR